MITCPECGQQANDDAKFCDRCGQGLTRDPVRSLPASIPPLQPNTELKGGYRILAVLSQNALENRYRAEKPVKGTAEPVQLREQLGPPGEQPEQQHSPAQPSAPADHDPAGPHAKTAELRPKTASTDNAAANGSGADASSTTGHEPPISLEKHERTDAKAAGQESSPDEFIESAGEPDTP